MPADIGQGELYERLLRRFARREIVKHRPGVPDRDLDEPIEAELRRLSIVAFGMFNRGSQWITMADLDADLAAVFGPHQPASTPDMRAPLRAAEITLGRFFFVHRARAQQDESRLETYEFLHATFGEFLVARFTRQALSDVAARCAASTMLLTAAPPDDDLLHALLSFAVLSARSTIIGFLAEGFAQLTDSERGAQTDLLKKLFRVVHEPRPARHFDRYQPAALPVPARHAAYSANLVLLAVCAAGSIRASDLFGSQPGPVDGWHRQTLLWRSQLGTQEWTSLVETLAVERIREGQRDLRLNLDDGTFQVPEIDPGWTYDLPPAAGPGAWRSFGWSNQAPQALRRKAYFMCAINDNVVQHTMDPLVATLGSAVDLLIEGFDDGAYRSAANALMGVWLLPLRNPDSGARRTVYERCAVIAAGHVPVPWNDWTRRGYAELLLDRLITDDSVTADLAADILQIFVRSPQPWLTDELAVKILQCSVDFLGQDHESDDDLAEVISFALMPDFGFVPPSYGLEALTRLAELGLPIPPLRLADSVETGRMVELVQRVARQKSELAEFGRRLDEASGDPS